jgi:alkanesulfonate monooxygenase SsuD/methylene tetrahydromethanopterin reductase-like flavin-dependent oxidoreductase (luciferase family)
MARRQNLTLRDLYNLAAAARWVLCGTPTGIADTLEEWSVDGGADGYNILLSTKSCRNSSTAASCAATTRASHCATSGLAPGGGTPLGRAAEAK